MHLLASLLAAASLLVAAATRAQPTPPPGQQRMLAELAAIAQAARDTNVYTGDRERQAFETELAGLGPQASQQRRWLLLRQLAHQELRLGRNQEAVEHLRQAWALVPALHNELRAQDVDRTQFALAVAYLRLGESQNCIARHSSESCIAPIGPGGVHHDQEGSRQGIALLETLLARNPQHLPARWLLNIAYMTVGGYPQQVPAPYLVSPSVFASNGKFPHFTDAAARLGVAARDLGGGVAIDDFDGDGRLDMIVSSSDPSSDLRFYAGLPDGTFAERAAAAGLHGISGGANLVQADYDNDGAVDLLVLRGAWLDRDGQHPKSLLHNDGHGGFTDVTFDSGLGDVHYPSQTAAWADYDNDGDLDLYVGNEWANNNPFPSQLFRNDAGRFVDVAAAAGVENRRLAKGVAWGDFDGDGWPDLYVSNLNDDNRLYRNRHDGSFEDVAMAAGVSKPRSSLAVVTWDYDNDGVLDLFVGAAAPRHGANLITNRTDELEALTASLASTLGLPTDGESGKLYRGLGKLRFQDATTAAGLQKVILSGGIGVGDLDGDGFDDLYLGTSYSGYEGLLPNRMFANRAGVEFADVTTVAGLGHLQKAGGIAVADIDADGDLDLFVNTGGMFLGDAFGDVAFLNQGPHANWLDIKLIGQRSNRSAIGARIRCDISDHGRRRSIYRFVGSGSSFGANPLRQRCNLGSARRVDRLEVYWPTSGVTQVLNKVAAGHVVEITEPKAK